MASACQACGASLTPDQVFCERCGTPTASRCHQCRAEVDTDAAFCTSCGAAVAGPPPAATDESSAPPAGPNQPGVPPPAATEPVGAPPSWAPPPDSTLVQHDAPPPAQGGPRRRGRALVIGGLVVVALLAAAGVPLALGADLPFLSDEEAVAPVAPTPTPETAEETTPTPEPEPTPTPDEDVVDDPAEEDDRGELTVALESAVAERAEEEGLDQAPQVTCPEIDRFVAGDLVGCDVDSANEPFLVSIHEGDGTHVALPWREPGEPPDVDAVLDAVGGSGQFCRDVSDAGYGYQVAAAYWFREGQPGRMDADQDGIPCGTVYDSDEITRFWALERPLPQPD